MAAQVIRCNFAGCSYALENLDAFIQHVKRVHDLPHTQRFYCPFPDCILFFSNIYNFKKHAKNHKSPLIRDPPTEHNEQCLQLESQPPSPPKEPRLADENNTITFESNLNLIQKSAFEFTLSMHKKNNITRQDVVDIQHSAATFCAQSIEIIEGLDFSNLDTQTRFELDMYMNRFKTAFEFIDTDYKFLERLKKIGLYEEPTTYALERDEVKIVRNDIGRASCLVLNPVEFQVKSYLKTGNILETILTNTKSIERSDRITHFVNGSLWNDIKASYDTEDELVPIWVYADEFEVNDCQSSHNKVDSICGIYYSFPTLPDEFKSKLSNILVAGFIRKVTISEVGVNKFVEKLIIPFKRLETEGIVFELNSRLVRVRFVVCLFQGDNLGVHTLLRLSTSFNSNFYCRFCKRHRTILQKDCFEHMNCMRNLENYSHDVSEGNYSMTGIAGDSEFNKLPSFHVINNPSVDAMHDLFSNGVCKYGFLSALDYFIFEKRYFTRAMLNTRVNVVSKTSADASLSRMPDFEETSSKERKGKTIDVRMTASEMKAFCRNFTFIVGPFVPCDDPVWTFCKVLIRTVESISRKNFDEDNLIELKNLIYSHHYLYQLLFKKTLKPKHHFLLHYPGIIRKCGPIERMMCFRLEANHQGFKEYAHVISSRVNIAYTLCQKSCLQFSHAKYHKLFFNLESDCKFVPNSLESRPYLSKIVSEFPFQSSELVLFASCIQYKGSSFKSGQFVTLGFNLKEVEEFVKHENQIFVICRDWKVEKYEDNYLAYKAEERLETMSIVSLGLVDGPPFTIHDINGAYYFRPNIGF